jgi:hypothetical protein
VKRETRVERAWWQLLYGRLLQLQAFVPPELAGTIQFEIRHGLLDPSVCFLELAPGAVRLTEGFPERFDAWVTTSADDLHALLCGSAAEPVLKVSGRIDLVRSVLTFLKTFEPPRAAYALRGSA